VIALGSGLARGALAFVLSRHDDIHVVGEVACAADIRAVSRATRPDIMIVDLELDGLRGMAGAFALSDDIPGCGVLILAEPQRAPMLGALMKSRSDRMGFIAKKVAPDQLVDAVRQVASGGRVYDPALVIAALLDDNPLTPREAEVLAFSAEGQPLKELAVRLELAPGTVRNYLSRVIGKVGARTRIDAIRIAQSSGWI
jgi:two-component system response regulator DesR